MPYTCQTCQKDVGNLHEYVRHMKAGDCGREEKKDENAISTTDSVANETAPNSDETTPPPGLELICYLCKEKLFTLQSFGMHCMNCKGPGNGQPMGRKRWTTDDANQDSAKRVRSGGSGKSTPGSHSDQGAASQIPNTNCASGAEGGAGIQAANNVAQIPIQVAQIQPNVFSNSFQVTNATYQPQMQAPFMPGGYYLRTTDGQLMMAQGPMMGPSVGGPPGFKNIKRGSGNRSRFLNIKEESNDSGGSGGSGQANSDQATMTRVYNMVLRMIGSITQLRNRLEFFEANMMMRLSNIENRLREEQNSA